MILKLRSHPFLFRTTAFATAATTVAALARGTEEVDVRVSTGDTARETLFSTIPVHAAPAFVPDKIQTVEFLDSDEEEIKQSLQLELKNSDRKLIRDDSGGPLRGRAPEDLDLGILGGSNSAPNDHRVLMPSSNGCAVDTFPIYVYLDTGPDRKYSDMKLHIHFMDPSNGSTVISTSYLSSRVGIIYVENACPGNPSDLNNGAIEFYISQRDANTYGSSPGITNGGSIYATFKEEKYVGDAITPVDDVFDESTNPAVQSCGSSSLFSTRCNGAFYRVGYLQTASHPFATAHPSGVPSSIPSDVPSDVHTDAPTDTPSDAPTDSPTVLCSKKDKNCKSIKSKSTKKIPKKKSPKKNPPKKNKKVPKKKENMPKTTKKGKTSTRRIL